VIDCDDIEAGTRFWSGASGTRAGTKDGPYVSLEPTPGGLRILLQEVPERKTAKSRLHIDIETDDVEAEVRRLEALGAHREAQVEKWWVMEDPCGNEFCVIPIQGGDFPQHAVEWDG
jgi:hypothetical protein